MFRLPRRQQAAADDILKDPTWHVISALRPNSPAIEGTDLFLKSAAARSATRQVRFQARPARPHLRSAHLRLRSATAREAEGQAHVRRAGDASSAAISRKPTAAKGNTGANLLFLLESRLDNVVYRMGFGSTRAEARQLVSHKAITVNGSRSTSRRTWSRPATWSPCAKSPRSRTRVVEALQLASRWAACLGGGQRRQG